MDLFNSALGRNITFIRPAYFSITGLVCIPHISYYYAFLLFVYIFSVIGNTVVMGLICLDRNLRAPKYVAVFNLALVDLLSSNALVPKMIDIFLFSHFNISYNDCLAFLFFCFAFLSMQAFNLVVLAYDRLVAIMFPLHYQTKVTNRIMLRMIAFFWLFVILAILIAVGFLTRLSFCNSVEINSFFCDHAMMYELACNDYYPSLIVGYVLPYFILFLPLLMILSSYICIGYALSKVASAQEGAKALKTCTAHISLVTLYFIPLLLTFTMSAQIHPDIRIVNLSLSAVFPPMLNPIIYVLQTQEIKVSMRKLFKIRRQSRITVN